MKASLLETSVRTNRRKLGLLDLPAEVVLEILHYLTCSDLFSLRRVSKAFRRFFTEEKLCLYVHRLYFPKSSEITRDIARPYSEFPPLPYANGGNTWTRKDFDKTYSRTRNWKRGQPTKVEVINHVADGSVLSNDSIVFSDAEGLLAYQPSRGIVVVRDLNRPLQAGARAKKVIDLRAELGECIMLRPRDLVLREGASIRLRMNRGMLLVVGEAHEHQVAAGNEQPATSSNYLFCQMHWPNLWNWIRSIVPSAPTAQIPAPQPTRILQEPHSLCAVFSLRPQDRGRLVQRWPEADTFMAIAALNEFYCIMEFHLFEQRLEGVIYNKDRSVPTYHNPPAHHFTYRKKAEYPHLSAFDIAADTKGKVFYLGFLPPPDRKPVVEVVSIPTQNEDGTWAAPTVIKRVVLRTLARPIETGGTALLCSYWIDFENGFEVNKYTRERGFYGWRDGEDVVRFKMVGEFAVEGATEPHKVTMITWYITARPSPKKPSSIIQWRTGQDWEEQHSDHTASPWADKNGFVNLQECYPTPTYYTTPEHESISCEVPDLPEHIDIDRDGLCEGPYQIWLRDEEYDNRFSAGLLYAESSPHSAKDENPFNHEYLYRDRIVPYVPEYDDHSYCPPGRHLFAQYKVCLETGKQKPNNLPMPGNEKSIMRAQLDKGDKRFLVYGQVSTKVKGTYKKGNKIVIVRYD